MGWGAEDFCNRLPQASPAWGGGGARPDLGGRALCRGTIPGYADGPRRPRGIACARRGSGCRRACGLPVVASSTSHLTKAPESIPAESVSRSPFGDGIAVTLADFRETQPDIAQRDVFGSDREFEASVASDRQPVAEPLARVDPSGDRLERLLAPALPAYSSGAGSALSGERLKQRASDDRLYESMDRYGSGGMSLEFRF